MLHLVVVLRGLGEGAHFRLDAAIGEPLEEFVEEDAIRGRGVPNERQRFFEIADASGQVGQGLHRKGRSRFGGRREALLVRE